MGFQRTVLAGQFCAGGFINTSPRVHSFSGRGRRRVLILRPLLLMSTRLTCSHLQCILVLQHCGSKFTPANRRHHCRFCGDIFCAKCLIKRGGHNCCAGCKEKTEVRVNNNHLFCFCFVVFNERWRTLRTSYMNMCLLLCGQCLVLALCVFTAGLSMPTLNVPCTTFALTGQSNSRREQERAQGQGGRGPERVSEQAVCGT